MKQVTVSKSGFIKGKQCHKAVWLYYHKSSVRTPPSKQLQRIFNTGHDIGKLAWQLFEGGKLAQRPHRSSSAENANFTTELLSDPSTKYLFEATFIAGGAMVITDVVAKNNDGSIDIYEVKSSTHVTETYINDTAFQLMVILKAGFKVNSCNIVYINQKYVFNDHFEIEKYFSIEDVTSRAYALQAEITEQFEAISNILAIEEEPIIYPDNHCFQPYECDFIAYCNQINGIKLTEISEPPIQTIPTKNKIEFDFESNFIVIPTIVYPSVPFLNGQQPYMPFTFALGIYSSQLKKPIHIINTEPHNNKSDYVRALLWLNNQENVYVYRLDTFIRSNKFILADNESIVFGDRFNNLELEAEIFDEFKHFDKEYMGKSPSTDDEAFTFYKLLNNVENDLELQRNKNWILWYTSEKLKMCLNSFKQ